MRRIDILKGIEQILVQKAYETGHISHRRDGDWQKTNNGWVRVKGSSAQSTPQAQEPAPAENTEYGEIVKQDFESVPKSIKDKMFTIAQQYKSEWAEDSDEDVRSMADDDVEAISQMLWDTADEETRNSWLDSSDEGDLEEDTPDGEDDWDKYDNITDIIQNTDWESIVSEYDDPSVDQIISDYDLPDDERIRDEISTYIHTNDSDEDEDLDATDAGSVTDLEEQTPDVIFRNADNIDKFLESNNINLSYGASQKFTDYVSELANAYRDGEDTNEVLEEFKQRNEVYNNEEAQKGYDTFIKYLNSSPLSSLIQKSAVRDMRSAPATKNMGF